MSSRTSRQAGRQTSKQASQVSGVRLDSLLVRLAAMEHTIEHPASKDRARSGAVWTGPWGQGGGVAWNSPCFLRRIGSQHN